MVETLINLVYKMKVKRLSYLSGAGRGLLGITVGDTLRRTAQKHPHTDALVSCQENIRWNYAELLQRSERIAEALVSLGLPRQSRIGIFALNTKE